jgi:poly-gamma-glutamate capsule biosynthesis protein CapA/YwtB (metallophosphatase superfamily)
MGRDEASDGGAPAKEPAADAKPEAKRGARLTRRELLATVAVVSAAGVVACAPFPSTDTKPTPVPFSLNRPVRVAADTTVPAALAQAAIQRLSGVAGIPSAELATQTPDLLLTFGAAPQGYTAVDLGASPLALYTHLRVPVDSVTADQARKLLAGQVSDWSQVGGPYSLPVALYAAQGLAAPSGVSLAGSAKAVSSVDELIKAVRGKPGALAFAPTEAADWRVRNLGVDAVFPAQGKGDLAKAALPALTLRLAVSQELVSKGLDTRAVATALKSLLAAVATTVDMVAAGDIMLGRGVNNKMVAYGDYSYPYRGIHDELQSADYRVANLECTVTDVTPVPSDPHTFYFVSAAKAITGLTYAGFQTLTVANNHSNGPGGHPAFSDMLKNLRANNISVMGGGDTLAEARTPSIQTIKGVKFALLGYHDFAVVPAQGPAATDTSWGLAPAKLATLPDDITAARAKADIVIPYFHWGIEYTKVPTKAQQTLARAAIDAGADMVLGNHPHWTQGVEEYKGKLIIYSMGNFVFDQDWSRPTMEGMLIHFYWRDRTLVGVRFVPTLDRDRCQPRIMTQAEGVGVFQRMWSGTDILASGVYGPEYEP